MVITSHFRKGNKFTYFGRTITITGIKEDDIWYEDGFYKTSIHQPYLAGLKLTEELLEKIGFTKGKRRLELKVSEELIIQAFEFSTGYSFYLHVMDPAGMATLSLNHIKYLHQLQNLYHALTGEEMPLNL